MDTTLENKTDTEIGKELFCMAFDLPEEQRRLVFEAVRRLIGKEWCK